MQENTFICLLIGFLGVFIHCLFKAKSLITDGEKANVKFTVRDYIEKDWFGISISLTMVIVWLLIFPEVATARPNILNFVRISFGAMGLFGSYIIQSIFSRGKSYIRNIIDKKTNIADNVVLDDIGGGGIKNPPPTPEPEKD